MARANFVIMSLFFTGVLCGLTTAATPIRQCANDKPLPLMVQIDDCSTLPCALWMGADVDMAIQFISTKNGMTQLDANVRLTVLGAEIPLHLTDEQRDVCSNLLFGAYCPMDADEDVTFHLAMPLGEKFPEVPAKLEVSLVDPSDDSVVACFITDARLKRQ